LRKKKKGYTEEFRRTAEVHRDPDSLQFSKFISYIYFVSNLLNVLHREIPFLRICVPLCAGIVAGLRFIPGIAFISVSSLFIIILFFVSRRQNNFISNHLFGLPFSLTLFLLGLVIYNIEKSSLSVLEPESSIFYCTIADYPEEKANSFMLNVKLNQKIGDSLPLPVRGSIVIYLRKGSGMPDFTPGDRLIVRCTPIEIMNRGNPYEFNYKFYMENHGIKYYSFADTPDILRHVKGAPVRLSHRALIIRHRLIKMYSQRGVTEDRLPLVAALTLGDRSLLDQEQKENFIRAGVMHIMAVSGLHAVILSMFVLNALFFLKRRFNILRVVIAVLFLWLFAFVTGLTPSVMRATIMFTFLQAGNLLQRKVNGINSVLASAFVLILARPSVIFDAGFLLSYSAVIFIIAFYQDLYMKFRPENKAADWIWQSATVTIVAQLGTLPLTIMLFNRFPAWFLLTNIIIVPLSSLAIILGCLIPLLYPLKFVSGIIGLALDRLTWLTEFLTEKAAELPMATIANIGMTVPECILLFSAIFAMLAWYLKKESAPVFVPAVLFAVYLASVTITGIAVRSTDQVIVYNTPGYNNIGIRTGDRMLIYSDTLLLNKDVARHCASLGIKSEIKVLKDATCVQTGDKSILICRHPSEMLLSSYKPGIIILTGPSDLTISNDFKGEIIIASGTNFTPRQVAGYVLPQFRQVRKTGAWISRL
jgi:competence protein ComEC